MKTAIIFVIERSNVELYETEDGTAFRKVISTRRFSCN